MRTGLPLIFPLFLVAAFLFPNGTSFADPASISDYRPIIRAGHDSSGKVRIAIRQFRKDNVPYILLVDPFSLETSTVAAASFNMGGDVSAETVNETPFFRVLEQYGGSPCSLQNHGAVHSRQPVHGMFLTVDMCPSKKPFEKPFFAYLAGLSRTGGKGTAVAIAMTGNWLLNHMDEFAWITGKIREGKLAVTWVNHSLTHPYDPKTPLARNFLLSPGIDFDHEVLETERLLLENGQVPSIFFRFPGLVADARLVKRLKGLALIPLGSDAWLAKGEKPDNGSIILVHGNGNEPAGIENIMRLLMVPGKVKLLPLAEAFVGSGR